MRSRRRSHCIHWSKSKARAKPKPAVQPLPNRSTPAATSTPVIKEHHTSSASSSGQRLPPAPPRKVVSHLPPPKPEVPKYRAKYAFAGQEGEMSLEKDDVVELVEKDDNGWWLVKKDGVEGWAPHNYLELVPPKAAPAAPPPPPARPRPAPEAPPSAPKLSLSSVVADVSAKPVSVFPGMAPSNGSATPWKKPTTPEPSSGRPSPGPKPPGPPVATKPKPPPIAPKAGLGPPKIAAKPQVPSASRPSGGAPASGNRVAKPAATPGQMDLSAMVRPTFSIDRTLAQSRTVGEASAEIGRWGVILFQTSIYLYQRVERSSLSLVGQS